MATPPAERLVEALWQGSGEVYALLDGARDGRIYDLVRRSGLDHRCLLGASLEPRLARAAPYLVALGRRSAFTRELLELGWGRSWGLFLSSPALLQELGRHFRRFLDVEDPGGRPMMLRLWDPRVVVAFLPACTREELGFVFGPVEAFQLELAAADRLLRFRLRGGYLEEEIVHLEVAGESAVSRSVVAGRLRGPAPPRAGRPFRLRQPHWDALRGFARQAFVERALAVLGRTWPWTSRARGEAAMRALVLRAIERARGHGLTGRRSVLHFLNLMLAFGEDFDRLPWAAGLLARHDLRPATRVQLLVETANRAMAARAG